MQNVSGVFDSHTSPPTCKASLRGRFFVADDEGAAIVRTSDEVYALLERIARADGRIRVMTLEGSRVNPNAASDAWQDYDVTFLVTDVASFTCSDAWLAAFGDLVRSSRCCWTRTA